MPDSSGPSCSRAWGRMVAADAVGAGGELPLRTVESGGLRHEISDILRDAIWHGVLKPGQRLNEQKLSSEMGVSRPPLREAIRVLEQEGLVVSIPRRGAFVRTMTGRDIYEIYAVRCGLEGVAAELLIEHVSDNEVAELEAMVEGVDAEWRTRKDMRAIVDQDLAFHRQVVRLSNNELLATTWEQIAGQIRMAIALMDPSFLEPDFVAETHRPLVGAIARRDSAETWRLARGLLDVGRDLRDRVDALQDGRRSLDGSDPEAPTRSS
jgi:DNA-binding GntR family transcriptional regulator